MNEPRHETVTGADGVRLHCAVVGKGPLILFLHGFPEFWRAWKPQLERFGKDHRAVAPDLRGVNLSEQPADLAAYALPKLVADVRALGERYSPGRPFVLVGHDWGGAIAWAFAIAHPERLRRLAIVNAPHPGVFARLLANDPAQQRASAYMHAFRSPDAEKVLSADRFKALAAGVFNASFSEEERAAYLEAWGRPGGLTGGLNLYRANRVGPPLPGETPPPAPDPAALRVRVPTLVLWGEKDTALLPQNLDGLDAYVPNLTVRRIPDGTHWVVHEHPDRVEAEIRAFLR